MIIGLGSDLCDVGRIREALVHRRRRFLDRVLTADEQQAVIQAADEAAAVATLFVIKEAAVKALGTGITRWIGWHDVHVRFGALGEPSVAFSGGALRRLRGLTPKSWNSRTHVSASRSGDHVIAFVVFDAEPHDRRPTQVADV